MRYWPISVRITTAAISYSSDWTVDTAATCTKDGSKSQHCERCDAKGNITVIPATGHTFEWVIDKEATATEAGSKHEECTVCGYAKAAVEIPATGASESSQTGDDSNIALLAGLLALAAAVAAGTVVYGEKEKRTIVCCTNSKETALFWLNSFG